MTASRSCACARSGISHRRHAVVLCGTPNLASIRLMWKSAPLKIVHYVEMYVLISGYLAVFGLVELHLLDVIILKMNQEPCTHEIKRANPPSLRNR
jgi:hypothetical protein